MCIILVQNARSSLTLPARFEVLTTLKSFYYEREIACVTMFPHQLSSKVSLTFPSAGPFRTSGVGKNKKRVFLETEKNRLNEVY